MNESLFLLELQQDEVFERIVRFLANAAGVDVEDAAVRGCVAAEAEELIACRDAPFAEESSALAGDPTLTRLLATYDDLCRKITEAVARDMGEDSISADEIDDDVDLAAEQVDNRGWSEDY